MTRAASAEDHVRIGGGISVSDFGDVLVASVGTTVPMSIMPTVFVPIDLSARVRVEPEIGFGWWKTSASSGPTRSFTLLHVGGGIVGKASKDHFTAYYGARVGYLRFSASDTSPYSTSNTSSDGFFVAPTIGGEYFLSDALSLGGEVQVRYTSSTVKSNSGSPTMTAKTAGTHGGLTVLSGFDGERLYVALASPLR